MQPTEILFLIGRILYGGYFLMNGVKHFTKNTGYAQYAAAKGVPSPKFMVYFSGLFILLGGLGVLLGAYIEYAVALLVIFLVVVSFKMHNFWAVADPMPKMMEMVQFSKNIALAGAALMLLMIPAPWPMSLGS